MTVRQKRDKKKRDDQLFESCRQFMRWKKEPRIEDVKYWLQVMFDSRAARYELNMSEKEKKMFKD